MSFQEIVKIGHNKAIVLCRGVSETGECFFHYIKTDKSNLQKMQRDFAEKKEVDFSEYGEIIHSGWGENPSPADEQLVSKTISASETA